MRRALALIALLGACGGRDRSTRGPELAPRIVLVGCHPATPPPSLDARIPALSPHSPWGSARTHPDSTVGRMPKVAPHPSVSIGEIRARPISYPVERVKAAVTAQLPALRACYVTALASDPALVGFVSLLLRIEHDGRTTLADPTRSPDPALSACFDRVFGTLALPRASDGDDHVLVSVIMSLQLEDRAPARGRSTAAWTPFALDGQPPLDSAPTIARAVETGVRARLAAIEACFRGGAPTGSMRAMLELDPDGALVTARIGGLGDPGGEACVSKALAGLRVVTPAPDAVEVACDLSRGDAQPWRVVPGSGYELIEVSRTEVRHGNVAVTASARELDPLPVGASYLVVSDPDAPGTLLELALAWAANGDSTLIAIRDGAGAPQWIGMARSAYSLADDHEDSESVRASLVLDGTSVTTCVHSVAQTAPQRDAAATSALLARMASRCRSMNCADTVGVAIAGATTARDVAELAAAARRAGFERLMIGGVPGCR